MADQASAHGAHLAGGHGGHGAAPLAHHFHSYEQQREASALGMWVFIAQEVLFFGGLFATYTVYRMLYPDAFSAGSHHLSWRVGFANTLVLIGSSLTMALGVYSAAVGKRKAVTGYILATILLGSVFLGVKYFEYGEKIRPCFGDGSHAGCLVPGARFDAGEDFQYGVFTPGEDRIIGGAGLHRRAGPGSLDIGYWVHVDHVGRGLATELVRALTVAGLALQGIERIQIDCDPRNHRSRRIPEKLGYRAVEVRQVVQRQASFQGDVLLLVQSRNNRGLINVSVRLDGPGRR